MQRRRLRPPPGSVRPTDERRKRSHSKSRQYYLESMVLPYPTFPEEHSFHRCRPRSWESASLPSFFGTERSCKWGGSFWLDCVDFGGRLSLMNRGSYSRGETSAAERHHHLIHVRN